MTTNIHTRTATLISIAATLAACGRTPLHGPPELRLGRSECAECGMLVSEDRCSSSLLVESRALREHLLYDDIGCMLDHEHKGLPGFTIIERYVHDHNTRHWVQAENASFLFTDPQSLYTPMGSGIVAYSTKSDALAAAETHGGTVLDLAQLTDARIAWKQRRYTSP